MFSRGDHTKDQRQKTSSRYVSLMDRKLDSFFTKKGSALVDSPDARGPRPYLWPISGTPQIWVASLETVSLHNSRAHQG